MGLRRRSLPVPPSLPALVGTLALSLVLALGLRYGLLESETWAGRCGAPEGPWGLCALRDGVPLLFSHHGLGGTALVGGALGFFFRFRLPAWIGLVAGCAGLVLYDFEGAAVGGLLALLALAAPGSELTPGADPGADGTG